MTVNIDEVLASGNLEEMEKLLGDTELSLDELEEGAEVQIGAQGNQDVSGSEGKEQTGELELPVIEGTPKGDADPKEPEQQDAPGAKQDGYKEIDGQLYVQVDPNKANIASKNGEHTLPFDVLGHSRDKVKTLEGEISTLKQQLEESNTVKQRLELTTKQLEEAGIQPEKLPEELLNDPEALSSLKDELSPAAAKMIEALVGKVNASPGQPQQTETPAANPVDEALQREELKEINGWQEGDPDRWDMALRLDEVLQKDPSFSSLPLEKRFEEVQRRVKAAFGDPVLASAEKEIQKPDSKPPAADQSIIPNSPTDLAGSTSDNKAAGYEAIAAQDAVLLEQTMEGMSEAELEQFLESAVDQI